MGMEEKYIQQFKKGAYEMILLSLIAQKETYGYAILTEIQKQGGEIFAFAKEGTIYPILYRLTKAGLIQYRLVPAKANGGEKKYYSLTREGKDMLEKMKNFIFSSCIIFLSPSVTAGRRPRLRGWRSEDSALALRRAGTPGK